MPNQWLALDVWTDPKERAIQLTRAWQDFILGNPRAEVIRPAVSNSWLRCLQFGVHPEATPPARNLSDPELADAWQAHPLRAYLEPVLKELTLLADGSGHLVVVTDARGHLLRMIGDPGVWRAAERMNFVPGSLWSEASAGTNAIGTALAERHPIQIFAAEHFCEPVHRWTCSAAPIIDPATGQAVACIDLTGFREKVHPHTLATVAAAAQSVERQLRDRLQEHRLYVVERFLDAVAANPRWELAAVDESGTVLKAAPVFYSEGWVDPSDRLSCLAACNLTQGWPEGWEAESRHGVRRFEARPVHLAGRVVGALVRMAPPGAAAARGAEPLPPPPVTSSFASLVGSAPVFREAVQKASQYAASHHPILIEGESGTGKELLAQAMHMASRRSWGPFVAVNAGAIPKDLVASEFFGYVGGTFTGAVREGRPGKFEAAHGGTIFLDEIGEMPLDAQVYLLRVLEQGEVVRLGARAPVRVDVRVIAATNRNLAEAVRQGQFRQDLYYRLNVLSIKLPPLRDRRSDIPLLMEHYLERACRDSGHPPITLSPEALDRLMGYDWPGNVRELRNLAYRLVWTICGSVVLPADLPVDIARDGPGPPRNQDGETLAARGSGASGASPGVRRLPDLERAAFEEAWLHYSGQAALVAQALGISRATAYRKAHRYGLLKGEDDGMVKSL